MMAGYNAWANKRVYDAAASLTDSDYRADRGAFFKSVHGTLNHLLVTDRIWMRRFTGTGDAPTRLDAILFDDLSDLRAARRAEDQRIESYVAELDETRLNGLLRYCTISNPTDFEQPLASTLIHFFNHQTHHRGQVHALLTGLTGTAPSLDLIVF
ncbi:DinB family protein [Microvirga massiliensis]|uniref:DinB family protein n=1 Tax=Microvirga massiliensis TaxID=1033741 RepID=UPI00062BDA04|nr:DinB family protein [Microvirga massiliensis]